MGKLVIKQSAKVHGPLVESFGALSNCFVTQKRLAVEQNWLKFGTLGVIAEHVRGNFDLLVFKVI